MGKKALLLTQGHRKIEYNDETTAIIRFNVRYITYHSRRLDRFLGSRSVHYIIVVRLMKL